MNSDLPAPAPRRPLLPRPPLPPQDFENTIKDDDATMPLEAAASKAFAKACCPTHAPPTVIARASVYFCASV